MASKPNVEAVKLRSERVEIWLECRLTVYITFQMDRNLPCDGVLLSSKRLASSICELLRHGVQDSNSATLQGCVTGLVLSRREPTTSTRSHLKVPCGWHSQNHIDIHCRGNSDIYCAYLSMSHISHRCFHHEKHHDHISHDTHTRYKRVYTHSHQNSPNHELSRVELSWVESRVTPI